MTVFSAFADDEIAAYLREQVPDGTVSTDVKTLTQQSLTRMLRGVPGTSPGRLSRWRASRTFRGSYGRLESSTSRWSPKPRRPVR